jgi:hypothetical protein
LRDRVEQLGVRGWIRAIDAAGHDSDRGAAGDQCAAVGGLVDAERKTADDRLPHGGELSA